ALAPLRGDEPLRLEAVERGGQRALRDVDRFAGDLVDAEQDAVAMERLQRDGLQDQQVERARQQLGGLAHAVTLLDRLGVSRLSPSLSMRDEDPRAHASQQMQ